jgi:hypothetical protein
MHAVGDRIPKLRGSFLLAQHSSRAREFSSRWKILEEDVATRRSAGASLIQRSRRRRRARRVEVGRPADEKLSLSRPASFADARRDDDLVSVQQRGHSFEEGGAAMGRYRQARLLDKMIINPSLPTVVTNAAW